MIASIEPTQSPARSPGPEPIATVPPPLQALRAALGAALDAFAARGEALTLFVDNYAACSAEIHAVFAELLATMPGSLHLVMAVRVKPDSLPLASLAARDELVLIGSDELSFELKDTEQFVAEVLERAVEPRVLRDLHERAEGWPAGVRLLCAEPPPSGGVNDISSSAATLLLDSLFTHEVLESAPCLRLPLQGLERYWLLSAAVESSAMAEALLASCGPELLALLIGSAFFTRDSWRGALPAARALPRLFAAALRDAQRPRGGPRTARRSGGVLLDEIGEQPLGGLG